MITDILPIYADGRVYDQIFHGTLDMPYWQMQMAGSRARVWN
jgi:tricorn protease-like protein